MKPRARKTDPSTSHQAARSVKKLLEKQCAVLMLLKQHPLGLTLEELVTNLTYRQRLGKAKWQSDSGIRTRCSELVTLGYVVPSGIKRVTRSGRRAIVWVAR